MKRRILSTITALALIWSLCPAWAFAAEADPALCPHHPEHTAECGYIPPTEGQPCAHEHTDECYTEETACVHVHDGGCYSGGVLPGEGEDKEADACAHVCTAESGCIALVLDCQHAHDETCGYVQADPGAPCTYICNLCPIEELISALPNEVTMDNAAEVRARLDEILALYRGLTEEEQDQLDLSRCLELQAQLDGDGPAPLAGAAAAVTVGSSTRSFSNLSDAWDAANCGQPAVVTLLQDADLGGGYLKVEEGSDIELRGGSYTISTSKDNYALLVYGRFTLTSGTVRNNSRNTASSALTIYFRPNASVAVNGGTISSAGGRGIQMYDGSLTITGGTVSGGHLGASVAGGSAAVSGGEISGNTAVTVMSPGRLTLSGCAVKGSAYGLQVNFSSTAGNDVQIGPCELSGNYSVFVSQRTAASLLENGCAYYRGETPLDYPSGTTITGSVSVRTCGHSSRSWEKDGASHWGTCKSCKQTFPSESHRFDEYQDLGDGTHQAVCGVCGQTGAASAHTCGDWSGEDEGHVRVCTLCGAEERVAHSYQSWSDSGDAHSGVCAVCGVSTSGAHNYGSWRNNPDEPGAHIRACQTCGKTETAAHSGSWNSNQQEHYRTCPVCGTQEREEHLNKTYRYNSSKSHVLLCDICGTGHLYPHEFGPWADEGDGYYHIRTCTLCGYEEYARHQNVLDSQDETGHTYACSVCQHQSTEAHAYSWSSDGDNHWQVCQSCQYATAAEPHTFGNWQTDGKNSHSRGCSACGKKETEPHIPDAAEENRCSVCHGLTAAAVTVTIGGRVTEYDRIEKAWSYAKDNSGPDNPATIFLAETQGVSSSNSLAPLRLTSTSANIILQMAAGAELYCENNMVISIAGENDQFTLESGTIRSNQGNGIMVWRDGSAVIRGGTVIGKTNGVYMSSGTVRISGGAFTGGQSSLYCNVSGGKVTDMLEDGYSCFRDGSGVPLTEMRSDHLGSGTVTVEKCVHRYGYATNLDGTHSYGCTVCGRVEPGETRVPCAYTFDSGEAVSTGQCECGSAMTVRITDTWKMVYNGVEKTPAVQVTRDGSTVPAGDFSVTYANNIKPGTATATVHCGNAVKALSFTIEKAEMKVGAEWWQSLARSKPYDGTTVFPGNIRFVAAYPIGGDDVTLYSTVNHYDTPDPGEGKTVIASGFMLTGKDAGNYYLQAPDSLTFPDVGQITKAELRIASASAEDKVYDGTTDADVSVTLAGMVNGETLEPGVDYDIHGEFDSKSVGKDKTVSIQVSLKSTEKANHYTLPDGQITVSATILNISYQVTSWPAPGEYTYGQQLQDVEFASGGSADISGDFSWEDRSTVPEPGGSYVITFTPDDQDNYEPVKKTVPVTVKPCTPFLDGGAPRNQLFYGQTLSSAGMSMETPRNPYNGEVINGVWVWEDLDFMPAADAACKARFIPSEPKKYNSLTVDCEVVVEDTRPEITLTAEPVVQLAGGVVTVKASAANPYNKALNDLPPIEMTYQIGDGAEIPLTDGSFTVPEGTAAGTKITIRAETEAGGMYMPSSKEITVTVTDKYVVEIKGVELTGKDYDGEPAAYTGAPRAEYGGAAVSVSGWEYVWKDSAGNVLPEAPKDAGSYQLEVSVKADDPLYAGAKVLSLEIGRAEVTVTALDKSAKVDEEAPDLSAPVLGTDYTVSGLVKGDTLKTPPVLSYRSAPDMSREGTAVIIASGAAVPEGGNYKNEIKYNPGTLTISGSGGTTNPPVDPDPPVDPGPGGAEIKLETKTGITEVPPALLELEHLNTPEKLEAAMRLAVTQTGAALSNSVVYDVRLLVSTDGGKTWAEASEENFPADGKLTVTLPYPEGTDSSCKFTVAHMFTRALFGKTPGEVETPPVTNTEAGIQFVVTGLSPISVGWEKPGSPANPSGPSSGDNHGGGGGVSTYAVTVAKSEHGTVTSNRANAASGTTVTLTVTPDSGYVLDTLTVTDSRGSEVKLTAQANGKYTFTMPGRAVTVTAAFAPIPDGAEKPCDGGADCPSRGFTDLGGVGTWYHEAVDYVLRNGLMSGYGNGLFGPNDTLSRAQLAQILYNKEGRPSIIGGSVFTDVPDGMWYTAAITWAAQNGIVSGYGNGLFGPNDNITREQLAVMLWRYSGSPAATNKELHFTDTDEISDYALNALRWAVENGILNGYGDGRLGPKGQATRAQVAQMLKNYLGGK